MPGGRTGDHAARPAVAAIPTKPGLRRGLRGRGRRRRLAPRLRREAAPLGETRRGRRQGADLRAELSVRHFQMDDPEAALCALRGVGRCHQAAAAAAVARLPAAHAFSTRAAGRDGPRRVVRHPVAERPSRCFRTADHRSGGRPRRVGGDIEAGRSETEHRRRRRGPRETPTPDEDAAAAGDEHEFSGARRVRRPALG